MHKILFKYLFFLFLELSFLSKIEAQSPIRFQNLTVNDGLSMGTITDFQKDRNGFIWIATAEGLHRFDGKYFKVFKHVEGSQNTLTDSYITCLAAIGNQLFVGNDAGVIDVLNLDNYTFSSIDIRANASDFDYPITDLELFQNSIVITTNGGGIWCYNLNTKKLSNTNFKALSTASISDIYIEKDAFYFVEEHQVYTANLLGYTEIFSNSNLLLSSICRYKSSLVLGSNKGLYKLASDYSVISPIKLPPKKRAVNRITKLISSGSTLWVGSKGGLMRLENDSIELYKTNELRPFSLVSNQITNLFFDSDGILWVGTIAGVSSYAPKLKKFGLLQYIDFEGKNYNNNIYYTYEDSKNNIWLGTLTSGLIKLNSENKITKVYPQLKDGSYETKAIRCIFEDSRGQFWIGTRDEGIFKFNPETGQAQLVANIDNGKIGSNIIREIFEDTKRRMWFGTQNGLYLLDSNGAFSHFETDENTINNSVYQIEQYPGTNELIIATFRGGIKIFDPETGIFKHFKNIAEDSTSLSNNNIMCMTWLNADSLLVGTYGGGLNIFDINKKTFGHITERNGLVNNAVYGILYEGSGICWLSTNNGLVRYSIYNKQFINFKPEHYLQNTEYNEGAFLKSSKGYYYFGGVSGLNYFKPSEIEYDRTPAPLFFTDVRGQFDKKEFNKISLSFLNSRLEIDFMSLYYSNPNGVNYKYQLKGFDNNWVNTSNSNTAVYPRLSPGKYRFSVVAQDEFGNWKTQSDELIIRVEPPFWQKWWFITLCIVTIIGLIYAIIRYRTREIERAYKLQLVDSELAALRSQMNPHFIFNSLNSIQYFVLKKEPKEAYTYLSKFASLMRKILQNSHLKYISVQDEVDGLNLYLEMEKMRMDDNLDYSISTENIEDLETTNIPTMLIQPFVENSIVHGLLPKEKNRKLDVVISKNSNQLLCSVLDNGIGREESRKMNAKRSSKHKSAGMDLTSKRLKILSEGQGDFDVTIEDLIADDGKTGTLVKLVIPIIKKID